MKIINRTATIVFTFPILPELSQMRLLRLCCTGV